MILGLGSNEANKRMKCDMLLFHFLVRVPEPSKFTLCTRKSSGLPHASKPCTPLAYRVSHYKQGVAR